MLGRKRLRTRVIPRVQVKRPCPGKLRGPRLTGKFGGRKWNGRMPAAIRSAVESGLDKQTWHGATLGHPCHA